MTEYPVVLWRKNGARYADDDGDREKQFGYCARVFVRAFKVVDMLFYPPSHARANRIAFVKFANNALWVRIVYGYADVSFDAVISGVKCNTCAFTHLSFDECV